MNMEILPSPEPLKPSKAVPMIMPEINPHHLDIIPAQQKANGWKKGFIVVKPNCSIQSYMSPIHALLLKGYDVQRIIVTTMQAVSGAGYEVLRTDAGEAGQVYFVKVPAGSQLQSLCQLLKDERVFYATLERVG